MTSPSGSVERAPEVVEAMSLDLLSRTMYAMVFTLFVPADFLYHSDATGKNFGPIHAINIPLQSAGPVESYVPPPPQQATESLPQGGSRRGGMLEYGVVKVCLYHYVM